MPAGYTAQRPSRRAACVGPASLDGICTAPRRRPLHVSTNDEDHAKEIPLYSCIPISVDEALAHTADGDFAIAMSNLLFDREAHAGYAGLAHAERTV
jgi:hypothetical protein